jgi:hypothetical protein
VQNGTAGQGFNFFGHHFGGQQNNMNQQYGKRDAYGFEQTPYYNQPNMQYGGYSTYGYPAY